MPVIPGLCTLGIGPSQVLGKLLDGHEQRRCPKCGIRTHSSSHKLALIRVWCSSMQKQLPGVRQLQTCPGSRLTLNADVTPNISMHYGCSRISNSVCFIESQDRNRLRAALCLVRVQGVAWQMANIIA